MSIHGSIECFQGVVYRFRMFALALIIGAALITSWQIGTTNVLAAGECPPGSHQTDWSYSEGCSNCWRPWEFTRYWWKDIRWKCSDGSSHSEDSDGSCGSC